MNWRPLLSAAAFGLVVIVAGVAAAAPPIDAAGRFKHVVTLRPEKATAPQPIGTPLRVMAYGEDADGTLLVQGDSEYLVLGHDGRLDRDRFSHAVRGYPTMGTLVPSGDSLTFCAQADKRLYRYEHGGRVHRQLPANNLGFGMTCQLWATSKGYVATQPFPLLAVFADRNGKITGRTNTHQPFLPTNAGKPLRPCGMTPGGRPIAAMPAADRKSVTLFALGDDLKPARKLWHIDFTGHPYGEFLAAARMPTATGCGFSDGHTVFWFHGQVLVFKGSELVTAIRNGSPMSARTVAPRHGTGPYGFSTIAVAKVLDKGRLLAVVARDTGEIKLYGADKKRAKVYRKQPKGPLFRADLLLRWASRHMPLGPTLPNPRHPPAIAQQYLVQAQGIAAKHPGSAVAHAAVARLAGHVGKNALRAKHLGLLAKALQRAPKGTAARFPELFDHYARAGDTAMMKRFVAGLADKGSATARRWKAQLLRMDGRYDKALKALGKSTDPQSLSLRARLLADTGKLNDAIAAWTSLVEGPASGDPEAHNGLGVVYLRRGLVELAIQAFNKAIQKDADNPTYRANLATAYGRLDKKNDALKHVFSALGKTPNDPLLRLQLAHLSAPKTGRMRSAKKKRKKAVNAVAVLPLTTHGSDVERAGLGELVAAMMITAISSTSAATVVERERLDDILAEQKLQRSRYVDRKTAVRLAKLIGAKRLVTGNAAEFKGTLRLDVRVISVANGKVLKATQATVPLEPATIDAALQKVAAKLLK